MACAPAAFAGTTFDYLNPDDGKACTASVKPLDRSFSATAIGVMTGTIYQPLWNVTCGGVQKTQKWLAIVGLDGKLWWLIPQAEYQEQAGKVRFWYQDHGPGDPPPGKSPETLPVNPKNNGFQCFGYFAPDKKPYKACLHDAPPRVAPAITTKPLL
jgi:hypothetical protein